MLIEVATFRLVAGADEDAFLEADHRVQALVSPQKGFVRRTTARGADGHWLVIVLWQSSADADAAAAQGADDPATVSFTSFLDSSTLETRRYETLD